MRYIVHTHNTLHFKTFNIEVLWKAISYSYCSYLPYIHELSLQFKLKDNYRE